MRRRGYTLWAAKWVASLTCVTATGWWCWVLSRSAEPCCRYFWLSDHGSAERTVEIYLDKRGFVFWSEIHTFTDILLPPHWTWGLSGYRPYLLPELEISGSRTWLHLPPWLILVLLVAPTLLLWRLDRRRPQPGHCRCGYNLTGNTSGRCPECGRTATNRETRP